MPKSIFLPKYLFFVFFISIFFISCSNSEQENNNNVNVDTADTAVFEGDKSNIYATYNLPLPIEIYKFLRTNNYEFNSALLNSKKNKTELFTELRKSINLGFYSSDLAYCILFEQSTLSVDYFSAAIELAQELDITKGYNEEVLDRTYDNIENNDTLSTIANQAYKTTCNYLEENEKINILPFTIVGSWIEGMYILTENIHNSKKKELIFIEIYNQKESLNNLINYLHQAMTDSNAFIINDDIQEIIKQLKQLKNEFNKIEKENIVSFEKQFKNINSIIVKFRNKYI